MIVALAGRRIDAPDSDTPRFPAANVTDVQSKIRAALTGRRARALVCSAACGVDLLALEAAGELGIRRRVVIPFAREIFRETSVVDRSGDWGQRYDTVLSDVERRGDLVVLGHKSGAEDAYPSANRAILDQAILLARETHEAVIAIVVWDGKPRDSADVTEHFRQQARNRDLPVLEIKTI